MPMITIGKNDTSSLLYFGLFFISKDNMPIFLSEYGG